MPSYVVTGASRGLGYEFVRQLASDPKNTVVGLARNKAATEEKFADEIKAGNLHILTGDLDDYESLKKAAEDTAAITGGSLDYLVANAAYMPIYDEFFATIKELASKPSQLDADMTKMMKSNVTGNILLFNVFLPLILMGEAKKVITITSGMSDIDLINKAEVSESPIYAMTKAAMNVVTAKFNLEYKDQGVLFIGICPGIMQGDGNDPSRLTEQQMASGMKLFGNLCKLFPTFKQPQTPAEAVPKIVKIWEGASLEKGDGGAILTHTGVPGQWL